MAVASMNRLVACVVPLVVLQAQAILSQGAENARTTKALAPRPCRDAVLTKAVKSFRDDQSFYKTVRGYRDETGPRPTRGNIDRLLSRELELDREWMRELFLGFVSEQEGDLPSAEDYYRRTLAIRVVEMESYYAHRDLARTALKRGAVEDAVKHLQAYLGALSQEIDAGEGKATEMIFPYGPAPEALPSMKDDKERLETVLADLKRLPCVPEAASPPP